MESYRGLLLLVPFCVTLFVHDLDGTDLWSAHEARAAQNAQRMLDDHSFGLPTLYDGQADLQKPPAFYWLVAGIGALNDNHVDRWAVRLPSAIAAILTVLMVWYFLVRQGRPVAGLIAALVLASAVHFTSLARTGRIDMPLTCAVTATMLLLSRVTNGSSLAGRASDGAFGPSLARPANEVRRHSGTMFLAGLSVAMAILLKGPIGIVLPTAAIMAWIAVRRRDLQIASIIKGACPVFLGAALAAPWFFWANERTGGEFFRVFFWYHHFQRATGGSAAMAVHPWWYYGPRFALDFLPWTPLLIAGVVCFFRNRHAKDDPPALFGLIWLVVMVSVLSIARFKRADYLLPAYPGAAIFLGCVGERWYQRLGERLRAKKNPSLKRGGEQNLFSPPRFGEGLGEGFLLRKIAAISFALMLTGCAGGWWWFHHHVEPRHQAVREQQAFAAHIRQEAPAPKTVLLFRVESHLLAFHLGRPVHTLVEWGELNERLAEPGTHYFVTRAEFVPECLQHVQTRRIEVVARSEDFASRAAAETAGPGSNCRQFIVALMIEQMIE